MANATADKAGSGAQPRTLHEGQNVVRAKYVADAGISHSATDVIQCVKVPRGAIIDEVVLLPLVGEGSTPAAVTVQVGDGVDPNRYISASFSATVILRATTGLGYKYDESHISDAAGDMWDTIDLTLDAGAISASQGFYLTVKYHLDD